MRMTALKNVYYIDAGSVSDRIREEQANDKCEDDVSISDIIQEEHKQLMNVRMMEKT